MGITVDHPYYLIGIPLVLAVFLFSARWLRMKNTRKKMWIIAWHGLAAVCLLLALCGIHIEKNSNTETTIFLLDASDSVAAKEDAMVEFVQNTLKNCPKEEKVGIVAFGGDAKVEQFVSENINFSGMETTPVTTATNLEKAVQSAMSMFEENTAKRLVLLTDGKENEGNLSNLTYSLTGNQVKLQVVQMKNEIGSEVYIDGMKLSKTVKVGDTFQVEVTVQSSVKTSAELSLYQGSKLKKKEQVTLQTGSNTFLFKDTLTEGGLKTYRAEIVAKDDTQKKNNQYTAFTQAKEGEKLLLIEGKTGQGKEFARMLKEIHNNYNVVSAAQAPDTLQGMMAYKAMIMLDVYAEDLPDGFIDSLESYVKDYGGGFVTIGGENSYALGGYRNTSIEKVLPVKMDLTGEKQIPSMGIAYVIDHSSSMSSEGGEKSKLSIAKGATIKALENMRDIDQVGVLQFDHAYGWVVPFQKADDKEGITEKIHGISNGGSTSIYPALKEAVKKVKNQDVTLKHVILLSDGEDGVAFYQYEELLKEMEKQKITLSTVAVGTDADSRLMKRLAEGGNGRFYQTDENTDLPRIFAQEVYLSTQSYLNNRKFTPTIRQSKDLLEGVAEDGLPSLLGYVSTSAKDTATVYLESDKQEPILASWRYGLGRTIAFTSDGENKWTGNYANWDKYTTLWKNILQWVIPEEDSGEGVLELEQKGSGVHLTYTTKKGNKNTKVQVISTNEDGEKEKIQLDATGVGKFEKDIHFSDTGVHVIGLTQKNGDKVVENKNTAVAIQYSMEYRYLEKNDGFKKVVKQMGGSFVKKPEQVYKEKISRSLASYDTTNVWLVVAMVCFCLYLVISRLQISFFDKWVAKYAEKKEAQKAEPKPDTQLKKEKKEKIEKEKPQKQEKKKKVSKKQQTEEIQNTAELLLKKKKER